MKKFLSAITLSLACLILVFIGPVYAADPEFHPDENPYDDLFYDQETFTFTLSVEEGEGIIVDTTASELFDFLEVNGDWVKDGFGNMYIANNVLSYTINDVETITHKYIYRIVEPDNNNYTYYNLGWYGDEDPIVINNPAYTFEFNSAEILGIYGGDVIIPDGTYEFTLTFRGNLPWTKAYSYGRVRSYDLDLGHQPGMTYDAANERVWVGFEDGSNLNFDVRNFDEGNYSEFGIVAAWQSPYKNFRVVNAEGTTTIEEWEDVAAVVFQPHTNGEPDPRGSSTLTVYYWVDGEIVTDTLDDLDLERAYFYGEVRAAITGEEHMVANVDDLVPLEDFLQYITAWDDLLGDISDQVVIKDDGGYEPDVVGVYNVVFGVEDAEGQESTLEVSIHVVDIVAPVISGVSTPVTISYHEEFNVSAWVNSLTVSDNYYTGLTIQIKSNTYSSNKTNIGTYQITVRSFDPSGNEGTLTRTINVVDGVGPVFTGPSTITTSVSEELTVSQIKAALAAVDAKDGNVTTSIVVDSDGLTGNATIPGTYDVVFRAEDAAGNQTFHTVTVSIVSAPPKFYLVDGSSIRLLPGANLTIEQIIQLLGFTEEYSLLSTNYDMNTTGHYTMTLSVDGQILTFNIFVLGDGDPALPVPVIPSDDSSALIWTIAIVSAIILGAAALFLVPKIIRRRNRA